MSYPAPEPGLVISYSYLWGDEASEGHAEGRKNRPCAIIMSISMDPRVPDGKRVAVLPITHLPQDPSVAVELPAPIKRQLGLDDGRSWIVLDELNTFVWPGFDLRSVPGRPGECVYGHLPPRFFDVLRERWLELRNNGGARVVRR